MGSGSGGFPRVDAGTNPTNILSETTGSGDPMNVMNPHLVCNFIIKT